MDNVIVAAIMSATNPCITRFAWQADYGQVLKIEGVELPFAYEVHFSNQEAGGTTVTQIGDEDGVTIPDQFFQSGADVYAWIYLHTGEDDGETVYKIIIPVRDRPMPSNGTPTPVQQDAITQAIAALDAAVEQTGRDVQTTNENVSLTDAARDAAIAAQGLAEAAQAGAESARDLAEGYRDSAQGYASDAQRYAEAAYQSEQNAAGSATSAYNDANRAEQAAAQSGYMFFYIDEEGYLHYQRTPNTQVDFYLDEAGYLHVRTVA